MLLQELAQRSGVSVASIKFYRREGLLPPGARITATRQDYGQAHLDRLDLIGTLRNETDASIDAIRTLLAAVDDPGRPLADALEMAQALASGLPPERHLRPVPPDEHRLVRTLVDELGWPDAPSGPRAALDDLLRTADAAATPVGRDVLLRYGRILGELAAGDLAAMRGPRDTASDGPARAAPALPEPSRDVLLTRAVRGMVTYERLARVVRALGHASLTIASRTDVDDVRSEGRR